MTLSITRWYDGTFRPRDIWEPELLSILWEECEWRGISPRELLQLLWLESSAAETWGNRWELLVTDLPLVIEVWEREVESLTP